MKMWRRVLPRVDQRIKTLNSQLRATKPEQRAGLRNKPEGDDSGIPLHSE
jgi:hypothetical protein